MRYFAALATVFATMVTANNLCAETWPYDGTGSRFNKTKTDEELAQSAKLLAEERKHFDRFKVAAERGNAKAMYDFATLLHQGATNRPPDIKSAYDLYEKAAEAGEYRANILLCPAYLLGINRPVNIVKGMNSYCVKLKPDQPALLFSGAYDYEHGLSGPKDETEALKLYMIAAQAGSGDAMNRLGLRALNELGKDDDARQWFRRASIEGSIDAMFNLAEMTAAGRGGFKDEAEATWLYVNAARRGHQGASALLANYAAPPAPLSRSSLLWPSTKMMQTIKDKNGEKTRPFDLDFILKYYDSVIPTTALDYEAEGVASVHCYITAQHVVDVCLTREEFPVGYNYAAVLQGIFGGKITVPPTDNDGLPTAHTVITLKYRWTFN
ncbi:tetratricopeptide repeat protein [Asticcacaulis sp. ZE23SCel15]|uniref:tetratricopeptide repeat protein n=1 Tax=Asticcacaulis sp. ZE23SCel15 TaxID=3059027 RepID=UPI00265F8C1C|nr:tetratricopeptide repeat protein [Asticcacaulis sp. ZE23SCel15]WKL57777.1 tetratricopeptide repeat protein [Asticcacaulis sp. ZE23SCel15]